MENEETFYWSNRNPFHVWSEFCRRSSYEGCSSYGAPLEINGVVGGLQTLKSCEYGVFINYRRPDFKTRFVHELCAALEFHGFRPFLNMENPFKMFPGFEEFDKAPKGDFVHVAIFSKGYAESYYCLDKLCDILKSKRQIIPVFYEVNSIDLQRIEDGPYKEAFMNHQKHGKTEKIPIWKEALRKVVEYKGFGMDEVNG